jgi:hypothetical protein
MVTIEYLVDGRKVSLDEFGDAITQAVLEQAAQGVQEALQNCSCTVHQQPSTVRLKSPGAGDVQFEIEGCCEEHQAALLKAINDHFGLSTP